MSSSESVSDSFNLHTSESRRLTSALAARIVLAHRLWDCASHLAAPVAGRARLVPTCSVGRNATEILASVLDPQFATLPLRSPAVQRVWHRRQSRRQALSHTLPFPRGEVGGSPTSPPFGRSSARLDPLPSCRLRSQYRGLYVTAY